VLRHPKWLLLAARRAQQHRPVADAGALFDANQDGVEALLEIDLAEALVELPG